MLGWLRRRDATVYPADEVGDALYEAFPDPGRMPARAVLRFEIYFAREADADALARHLKDRGHAFTRDHEPDTGGGIPSWDITADCPATARHLELKMAHSEVLRWVREVNGRLDTWRIIPVEALD